MSDRIYLIRVKSKAFYGFHDWGMIRKQTRFTLVFKGQIHIEGRE